MRNVIPLHVKCFFVRQSHPLGFGHPVLCGAELVGDEPFAVLLPDDLIDGAPKGALAQMVEIHQRTQKAVLAIEEVPLSEVHKYGVIKPQIVGEYPTPISGIGEKPRAEESPSNWYVAGCYILTPDFMEALKAQTAGAGDEIQLTDAVARCVDSGQFVGHPFHGKPFDCGNKRGFLEANMHFGLKPGALL